MINLEKNHKCDEVVERLLSLYENAIELAVKLIQEYPLFLEEKKDLDQVYKYSFDSELPKTGRK